MENARALDDRLKRIIKEVSDRTGSEIKRELLRELAVEVEAQQGRDLRRFLESFHRALKKI